MEPGRLFVALRLSKPPLYTPSHPPLHTHTPVQGLESPILRPLNPGDGEGVRLLCEECFPLTYPDSWYCHILSEEVRGEGRGGEGRGGEGREGGREGGRGGEGGE